MLPPTPPHTHPPTHTPDAHELTRPIILHLHAEVVLPSVHNVKEALRAEVDVVICLEDVGEVAWGLDCVAEELQRLLSEGEVVLTAWLKVCGGGDRVCL